MKILIILLILIPLSNCSKRLKENNQVNKTDCSDFVEKTRNYLIYNKNIDSLSYFVDKGIECDSSNAYFFELKMKLNISKSNYNKALFSLTKLRNLNYFNDPVYYYYKGIFQYHLEKKKKSLISLKKSYELLSSKKMDKLDSINDSYYKIILEYYLFGKEKANKTVESDYSILNEKMYPSKLLKMDIRTKDSVNLLFHNSLDFVKLY